MLLPAVVLICLYVWAFSIALGEAIAAPLADCYTSGESDPVQDVWYQRIPDRRRYVKLLACVCALYFQQGAPITALATLMRLCEPWPSVQRFFAYEVYRHPHAAYSIEAAKVLLAQNAYLPPHDDPNVALALHHGNWRPI